MVPADGHIKKQRSRLFVEQHVLLLGCYLRRAPESPSVGPTRRDEEPTSTRNLPATKRWDEFLRPPNRSAGCHPANASLRPRLPLFTVLFAGPAILHARILETSSSTPHQASLLETHQHPAILRQRACQARSISAEKRIKYGARPPKSHHHLLAVPLAGHHREVHIRSGHKASHASSVWDKKNRSLHRPRDSWPASQSGMSLLLTGVMREKGVGCQTIAPPRLPFPRLQRSAKLYFVSACVAAREPTSCTRRLDV
ncbi:hypothetical protein LA080_001050 [Diaporthe eres]|nr:hypothetical protein LA080_001050 [Diaporthe eres]